MGLRRARDSVRASASLGSAGAPVVGVAVNDLSGASARGWSVQAPAITDVSAASSASMPLHMVSPCWLGWPSLRDPRQRPNLRHGGRAAVAGIARAVPDRRDTEMKRRSDEAAVRYCGGPMKRRTGGQRPPARPTAASVVSDPDASTPVPLDRRRFERVLAAT